MSTSFRDLWDKAAGEEVKRGSFDPLPEGSYTAEVLSCKMGKTKAGDKDMISWDMKVVEGEQKNNHVWQHRPFSRTDESESNMKAIERATDDFKLLGLPCGTADLEKSMLGIVGKQIELSIKNSSTGNGQFINFKRIVPAAAAAPVSAEPAAKDDGLPF